MHPGRAARWDVETTRPLMNRLAPFLGWLFAWNHNWVMARGECGLAARLRDRPSLAAR
jgi:hypothetical protein